MQKADGTVGNDTINKLFDEATAELDDDNRAALANRIDEELWKIGHQLPSRSGRPSRTSVPGAVASTRAPADRQLWFSRTAWTSAPSAIVEVKNAIVLLPEIVSRPM